METKLKVSNSVLHLNVIVLLSFVYFYTKSNFFQQKLKKTKQKSSISSSVLRHYDKTKIFIFPQVKNTHPHMHSFHNQFPLVLKIGHFLLNLMTCQKNRLHTEGSEKKEVDSEGGVLMIFPLALLAQGNAGIQNKVKGCSQQRGSNEAVICVLSHLNWCSRFLKMPVEKKTACYLHERSINFSGYCWVTAPVPTRRSQGHHTQDHT